MAYEKVFPPGGPKLKPRKSGGKFAFSPAKKAPPKPKPRLETHDDVPENKSFPCANCGGEMRWNPSESAMACAYCGNKQEVPQNEEQVRELCYQTYFEKGEVAETVLEGAESESRCTGCGAQVMLPAGRKADLCPFCGSSLQHSVEAPKPIMAPGGVLPFLIDKPTAQEQFRHWVKTRWFAPNTFKKLDKLDRVNGMYVPYWTYDAMTYSFYRGQRGDAYYVTVGTGKNRRRQRRIRWSSVSGRVSTFFDDVTICASRSLPEGLTDELEPWDTKEAVTYRGEYLSGFQAERYQISARDGFDAAKARMDEEIRELVRRDIGGDEQRIHHVSTQYDGVTFKYLLLPVWVAAYRYQEKPWRVLVNARTGEVCGQRPWSWIKIGLAVIGGLAAIAVIVQLVMMNSA